MARLCDFSSSPSVQQSRAAKRTLIVWAGLRDDIVNYRLPDTCK